MPGTRYDAHTAPAFFASLTDRLGAVPGVEAVGRNHCLPLSQSCNGTSLQFLDRGEAGGEGINIGIHWVNPGYFEALRIPLVRGRLFTDHDVAGSPLVALVSESAARRYWPGSDPLGSRVLVNGDSLEVVGVVSDVHYESLEEDPEPQAYLAVAQSPRRSGYLVMRTTPEPTSLVPALRAGVRELDADLPFGTSLVTLFGIVGLILAAIGIYGVVAFGVAQQTHEIGIRVAIGAEGVTVLKMVVGRGIRLAAMGVVLGLGLVFVMSPILNRVLYGVRPFDPVTLLGMAALFDRGRRVGELLAGPQGRGGRSTHGATSRLTVTLRSHATRVALEGNLLASPQARSHTQASTLSPHAIASCSVLEAICRPTQRGSAMPVTVSLTFTNPATGTVQPLRNARVRYRAGPTSTRWVHQFTDAAGSVTINRNPRRGQRGIRLRVYSENPVVRVTAGTGRTNRVRFVNLSVRDGQTINVPGGNTADHFLIADLAWAVYEDSYRRFFDADNPLGDASANAARRIRVRWPGLTVGTPYTNPSGNGTVPVIHLSRQGRVNPANGMIVPAAVRSDLASELSHAIHFSHFGRVRRAELTRRYLASLGIESIEDLVNARPAGWAPGETLTPVMGFCEALDLFFNSYDATAGAPVAARDAATSAALTAMLATGADGTVATGPAALNPRVPARVAATVFIGFAGTAGIGITRAVDIYLQSRAFTFNTFRRRVRRRFGAASLEATALAAAGVPHGL